MCFGVCVGERERGEEREGQREKKDLLLSTFGSIRKLKGNGLHFIILALYNSCGG